MNEVPANITADALQRDYDETQADFNWANDPFSKHVWELKYKRRNETALFESLTRTLYGIMGDEKSEHRLIMDWLFARGIVMPGGRIIAGAGLDEHDSTLMNCYVMGELPDSLDGIMNSLHQSAITQKFGGGIGLDFTPIRPKGSSVSTAAFLAGGPIKFGGMWDAMGHALEAGGNRRGGKMMVLECTHPDIEEFITCKSTAGSMTSFNISVLITDAFIASVKMNGDWSLYHEQPAPHHTDTDKWQLDDGRWVYVWKKIKARDLWNKILEQTYLYSEPGLIFIDRINEENPINYAECIRATNPCGEQPLPPYGACDLGAINLSRLVRDPFLSTARFDYDLFRIAVKYGVRFLDCVLDVTKYPLQEQKDESMHKRRIGLGISGFADACAMLGIRYGSSESIKLAATIGRHLANEAYMSSAELSEEKGKAPVVDMNVHMDQPFIRKLESSTRRAIQASGLRNSVLLTIAPTGTTSIVFGDISSGIEPHFAHRTERKVKVKDENNDDVWSSSITYSYAVKMYAHVFSISYEEAYDRIMRSDVYATAQKLKPADHVVIQAAFQYWIDASISKTINCPTEISFVDFKDVYEQAWDRGCKGCTTYRPSEVRGAVLISKDEPEPEPEVTIAGVGESLKMKEGETFSIILGNRKRPDVLHGTTYKIRWPAWHAPVYMTINVDDDGDPYELFLASKNSQHNEWAVALSVIISKSLQAGIKAVDIGTSLAEITLSQQGAWINGTYYGSIMARIGEILRSYQRVDAPNLEINFIEKGVSELTTDYIGAKCPACGSPNLVYQEGCLNCQDCGQSKCS